MIKVGCVGLGAISKGIHQPGIVNSPDIEIVALCDIDEALLKETAEKYGIPEERCFTDYHELIACSEVEVVDIATPNNVHAEIAICAAEAGKPFGVEKPLTLNGEEALAVVEAVKKAGVPNMVYFSYRFKSAARKAREIVRSGRLGRIYHINASYYQGWGLPSKDCPRVWRFVKSITGTGALGDLGSHALDLCRFIAGVEYTAVMADCGTFVPDRIIPGTTERGPVDVDDYANVILKTAQGIPCTMLTTRCAFSNPNDQRVEIYCEKGVLRYTLDGDPNVDLLYIKDETTDGQFVPVEIPEINHTNLQMQSFADIVNGCGDGLPATVEDGLKNMLLMDAIVESAETGKLILL